ncbi:MAG: GAF domain-containing protein [Opitutales bacterium]
MSLESRDITAIDALYRISSLTSSTDDPSEALQIILDEMVRVLDASSASISMINPETNTLNIEVYSGLPADTNSLQLPLGRGITGWVAQRGKSLVVPDVTKDPRYVRIKSSIRSEMAVPLEEQGTVIGVVNVDSEEVGAFDDHNLKSLTLLTNEAAKVVSRLWLIRQLKTKAGQLQSLVNVTGRIVSKIELPEVLVDVVRESRSLLGSRMCALFLLSKDQKTLRLASLIGPDGKPIRYQEAIQTADCSMGTVVQHQKSIEAPDISRSEEHHFTELIRQENLVSMLSVPITYEDEPIGVLNAYTDTHHRFNNDEKKLLETMARMGAVAIQNARLYARVFSSEESLRKTEKLTTLGLLAAEIAHEIRNPLTVIRLLFDAMDLKFPEGDMRGKDVEVIHEKLNQLEDIVSRVLQFGKARQDMHARCNIDRLIEDSILLVRLKLKQNQINIVHQSAPKSVYVNCNKGQIQQLLLNLMINAMEAIIQKKLSSVDKDEPQTIRISTDNRDVGSSNRVVVSVSDSGAGVAREIQEHIFDSFLTGKKDGTGLGLAISKRILKSHRGDIQLLQSGPEGTTFEFWLPSA